MSRRWLVAVSVVAHLTLMLGLVVSGVWRIDQVERGRQRSAAIIAPPPPPPPPAAGGSAPKVELPRPEPRPRRRPVPTTVQPVTTPEPAEPEIGTSKGSGDPGQPPNDSPCTENCDDGPPAPPVCGNGAIEAGEQCDDGNTHDGDGCSSTCRTEPRRADPVGVVPSVLQGLRISGETQLHPSTLTVDQMIHDGVSQVTAILKLCLDTSGNVASVRMLRSTRYDQYDRTLVAAVREWRYRPYQVNDKPVPACSTVTFVYTIR